MSDTTIDPSYVQRRSKPKIPLTVRILIGVALGIVAGTTLHGRAGPLGDLGLLVIQLLKALATPLILFAVLDAFLRVRIPARKGATLIALSLLNATVAIGIGLTVAHVVRGGDHWRGHMEAMIGEVAKAAPISAASPAKKPGEEIKPTLDPLKNFSSYVPENLLDPFLKNNIITVVLVAVLFGAALRKLKDRNDPETAPGLRLIEQGIHAVFAVLAQILEWIITIIPFAVFAIVAKVVGKTGPAVFSILGLFLLTVVLGLFLQAVVYYSLLLRTLGRTSPVRFFAGAAEAIVTALSCGSSLATLPVTLRCLNDRLRVSPDSARLAACVGTNLNHDGIILYEAVAAIFMAQAFGLHLSIGQQVVVALASVMAGIGIAGVPEAGLISLPLVLGAVGLPTAMVAIVIPLILPVDWIIGRCRAATNVLSDMTVATLLDRLHPTEAGLIDGVAERPEAVAVG